MIKNHITYERASQLLRYDPETGWLHWAVPRKGRKKEGRSGFFDANSGYWRITIDGRPYSQHRIVWLLQYGAFPSCQIDHVNRDKTDNRQDNLRLAPRNAADNGQNRRTPKNNKSGVQGVCQRKSGLWRAYITVDRKVIELGHYKNLSDAACARKAAELKYFTFANS